jgi:cobalt-zinc-cadmium efflux system membrane fusion protein
MKGSDMFKTLSTLIAGVSARSEDRVRDAFAIELSIFETGVPPEFRVWVTNEQKPVPPQQVELSIKLIRLGEKIDDINFKAEGDYLRGDTIIYEPHSFVVAIAARYQSNTYTWEYDNFEGRTLIEDKVAEAMEIDTEFVGAATLHKTIKVYGKLVLPANAKRQIRARFEGEIKQVHVAIDDFLVCHVAVTIEVH